MGEELNEVTWAIAQKEIESLRAEVERKNARIIILESEIRRLFTMWSDEVISSSETLTEQRDTND